MIDRKKIADALREIASFYAPDPDCTNAIYDSLTAIIDELDPPEPQPEPKESPIDPIERPLRNLILEAKEKGVNIRTWYQDLIFTPESLTSYLGNGKYRWWNIGNWELTKRKANMPMPEPEPEYKVGDWVEYKGKQYRISAFGGGEMMFFENAIFALTPPYPIRKLAPSEVIVKIGCLEGTVSQCGDKEEEVFALHTKKNAAVIPVAMLDSDTAALVKALLKAQEEK